MSTDRAPAHDPRTFDRREMRRLAGALVPGDPGYADWVIALRSGDYARVARTDEPDSWTYGPFAEVERLTRTQLVMSDGSRYRREGHPGYRVGEDGRPGYRTYLVRADCVHCVRLGWSGEVALHLVVDCPLVRKEVLDVRRAHLLGRLSRGLLTGGEESEADLEYLGARGLAAPGLDSRFSDWVATAAGRAWVWMREQV